MSLKPGTTLGHYVITETVGHGGMSTVYRARQESLQRDVAIKVLPDFFAADQAFRERFAREAATIARLRHPNIVAIFDFGDEDGTLYIVTEFLGGDTLAKWLQGPRHLHELTRILRHLADALDYAHEHGVLHRDIKPSNVILDGEGRAILTDFGLSRIVGSLPPLTRTGLPIGTPEYMAPELASGGAATTGVDHYAFAVMAFEMLTGELPYRAESPLAVLLAHVNDPPPSVSSRRADANARLDDVLRRALDKDPSQRYASATAFVEALSDAAGTAPTPAPPPVFEELVTAHSGPRTRRSAEEQPEPDARSARLPAAIDTIQEPVPLLSLGFAALAFSYAAILAPEAGGGTVAVALGMAATVVAGASGAFIFPRKYSALAESRDIERRRESEERQHRQLESLTESLKEGFDAAHSEEGAEVLERLSSEYHQLEPALARTDDSLMTVQVPALATETYRRGLSVLVDALELTTTASTPGPDRLRAEMQSLEREIEELKKTGGSEQRLAIRAQALESHRERLRLLEDLQIRLDQLFSQARQCEAALHRTRINLAALRIDADADTNVGSVVRALQRTIEQARAVQDEVRRLGY